MEILKLHEVKGIRMPPPYERILKILVSPEEEVLPLGLSTPIRFEKAIRSRRANVGVSLLQPGQRLEPHKHEREEETIYIISGRGEYTIAGKSVKFEPDTVIYIPAGEEHGFVNSGDEMVKQVWFMAIV